MLRTMMIFFVMLLPSTILYAQEACKSAWKPDLNDDGIVNYKDLWIVGHSFGLPKKDQRRMFIPAGDTNCDGQINALDWDYVWQSYNKTYPVYPQGDIFIMETPKNLFLGESGDFYSKVSARSKKPFTVKLVYQMTPSQGLSVKNELPSQIVKVEQPSYADFYFLGKDFSSSLKAEKEGSYQLNIRVEMVENAKLIAETTAIIKVFKKRAPFLNVDLSFSTYYQIHDSNYSESEYFLVAHLKLSGKDVTAIKSIEIFDETDNYSYPGSEYPNPIRIMLMYGFFQDRECKSLHAIIHTPYGIVNSRSVKTCGTPIPRQDMYQDCSLCHSREEIEKLKTRRLKGKAISHHPKVL